MSKILVVSILASLASVQAFAAKPVYVQLGLCAAKDKSGATPLYVEYYVDTKEGEKLSSGERKGAIKMRGMAVYQDKLNWDGPKTMKALVSAEIVMEFDADQNAIVGVKFANLALGVRDNEGVILAKNDEGKEQAYSYVCNSKEAAQAIGAFYTAVDEE